jgi:hypothetical protein
MKANYSTEQQKTSTVSLGNLYDINKQIMAREVEISAENLQTAKEGLRAFFTHHFTEKYFMLLCTDLRDYTLFNLDKTDSWKVAKPEAIMHAADDVIECMTNRGTILSIEEQDDGAWELWIRNDEGCFAYYLFPYGAAVLEY